MMTEILQRCLGGHHGDQTEKVMEGAMHCVLGAIHGNERNHRLLLKVGLNTVMDIDEEIVPKGLGEAAKHVKQAVRGDAVAHMAKVRLPVSRYRLCCPHPSSYCPYHPCCPCCPCCPHHPPISLILSSVSSVSLHRAYPSLTPPFLFWPTDTIIIVFASLPNFFPPCRQRG